MLARLVNPRPRVNAHALRRAVAGKVVVVTGASHGIGREVAMLLAAAGARTLLVARSGDVLDELVAELGPRAQAVECDLADPAAAEALPARLLAVHGHVDVVVSNAGKSIRRPIAASYDRIHDFVRLTEVNYLGPVRLLLGLLPGMRERGNGHVVNVSTIGVLVPPAADWSGYVASKTAFDRWLRSAAAEMTSDGVTVSTVYFALVHTRMSAPSNFDGVPGLTAQQAAGVVARAIVDRGTTIAPWWGRLVGAAAEVARRPTERAMRRLGPRFSGGRRTEAGA
jgi:NAD(P)-dependent dehydrogenase (short-subunit alcohol dehydrogenase family)